MNEQGKGFAMSERTVTMKGQPMTLAGQELAVGQPAPDVELTAVDLSKKKLSAYRGKVVVLCTVPSLDTSVCDAQTRRFNEEATALGEDVVVLTVSMDLPFAAKRWCGAAGVDRVECLSDYADHSFGQAYGLRVEPIGLLARSVSVIDRQGEVVYHQLVPEIAQEPDYEPALAAAKAAAAA
jgi:thiol peroxidase